MTGANTSEFKAMIAGLAATVMGALASPSVTVQSVAIGGMCLVLSAYCVSRGIAKCAHGEETKPPAPPA